MLVVLAGLTPFSAAAQEADPAVGGSFGPLFQEPTGIECTSAQDPAPRCKPGAVTLANLVNGKQLYWNSLEGMNQVDLNVVAEFGHEAVNGQSRVLDLTGDSPRWTVPEPFDGGANPQGNDEDNEYLPGVPHNNARTTNDGDLFCSDVNFLADGRLIAVGGTSYYQEPGVPGDEGVGKFGVV
ncbi:MAG: galactose oxidase, partial [Gammaproteobacteria bacterium]